MQQTTKPDVTTKIQFGITLKSQGWCDESGKKQQKNLKRVTSAIGMAVISFCKMRGVNGKFHANELHEYVAGHSAPASADRILRNLRQKGHIDYVVLNRRTSFYQITAIYDHPEKQHAQTDLFDPHFDISHSTDGMRR